MQAGPLPGNSRFHFPFWRADRPTVSLTVTGGTGTYANASAPSFDLSGTVSGGLTTGFTLTSFTGNAVITTSGTGGGGGTTTPTISTVKNNYGLVSPGLPNYGIAPSALFFIAGANLANTTTALLSSADPGLQTTVNNVTVNVTAGGTTKPCPLYYLSPTQIDAVLPGTTPTGPATITVNNNGVTSAAFNIVVVQSAFGILSYNGTLGAAYDANNALITATNAANPNQVIVLWGSGVGSDPTDDDRLYPQKQNNLTNIPMQAFVGGVSATLAYRGRSQFPGVDQVVLTIPGNVPTGCFVSLSIVSNNIVSNSVTIPIAASGKTCSDSNTGLTPDLFLNLANKTTVREGILTVSQSTTVTSQGTQTTGTVGGIFQSVTGFGTTSGSAQVSIGSCLVSAPDPNATAPNGTSTGLDAGSSIAVTGPGGSLNLAPLSAPGVNLAGFYAPPGGTAPASFIPATGGTYTFDNGTGGKDVQHFNATLTLPASFTWSNGVLLSSVNRSQGFSVSWTGGAAGSYVSITGRIFRHRQRPGGRSGLHLPRPRSRPAIHRSSFGAAVPSGRLGLALCRGLHESVAVHGAGPRLGVGDRLQRIVKVVDHLQLNRPGTAAVPTCLERKRTSASRYTGEEVRFPFRLGWNSTASYVGLLAASFSVALFISYFFGAQINNYVYDGMYNAYHPPPPAHPESVVLAIDERTLMDCGGIRGIRRPIARALTLLAPATPKAVAIDVILADHGAPKEDAALADALHATPNLVLSTELIDGGTAWEDPLPEFMTSRHQIGARLHGNGQGWPDPKHPDRSAQRSQLAAGTGAGSVSREPRSGPSARRARIHAIARRARQHTISGGECVHPHPGGLPCAPACHARTLLPSGPDGPQRLHEAPARRSVASRPIRREGSVRRSDGELGDARPSVYSVRLDARDRNQCGRLRDHGAADIPVPMSERCGRI